MIVERLLKVALLGSTWVLWLLLALSVLSLGVILERVLFFARKESAVTLRPLLAKHALAGDWEQVERALASHRSIEADVLRVCLPWRQSGAAAFADAVESELGRVRTELDRGTNILGTLGNNAPFVGLFGTVIGVIEAFQHLGSSTARSGNMSNVMSGIAEALIATAVGIFVAIPAVVAFNVAQKRAGDVESNTQSLAKLLTARLHGEERSATVAQHTVVAKSNSHDQSNGHVVSYDEPELSLHADA